EQVVAIAVRLRVVDRHRGPGGWRRVQLTLHPVGVADRREVLVHQHLVGADGARRRGVVVVADAEHPRVVARRRQGGARGGVGGAPGARARAFADGRARVAPEPLVPEVSTFEKLTTVIIESTACDSVATRVALVSGDVAKARHTSLEPAWTLVRPTSAQVRPPPVMPVTVVFAPPR